MFDRYWVTILVLGVACAKTVPPLEVTPTKSELWVDAYAPWGGDGGFEAALKTIPVVSTPTVIHLRSGLYRGPVDVPAGTSLVGHGQAVVYLEDAGAVVTAHKQSRLSHLHIQGGTVGLAVNESTHLEEVSFSGQRKTGVEVLGGRLTGTGVEISAGFGELVGIDAKSSSIEVASLRLKGSVKFGIRAVDSTVGITKAKSEGAATVLQSIGGRVRAEGVEAAGGLSTAISLTNTTATLKNIDVMGHEYAVLAKGGHISVEQLRSAGATVSGLSFVGGEISLKDVTVTRSGSGGAVQLLDATSTIWSLSVRGAQSAGVLVRKGLARMELVTVEGVQGDPDPSGGFSSGDAIHLRDAELEVGQLTASELDGAALQATQFAKARLTRVSVSGAKTAGISSARGSVVVIGRIDAEGVRGPVLAAFEEGRISVSNLMGTDIGNAVWADCLDGAFVEVAATNLSLERLKCVKPPDSLRIP